MLGLCFLLMSEMLFYICFPGVVRMFVCSFLFIFYFLVMMQWPSKNSIIS